MRSHRGPLCVSIGKHAVDQICVCGVDSAQSTTVHGEQSNSATVERTSSRGDALRRYTRQQCHDGRTFLVLYKFYSFSLINVLLERGVGSTQNVSRLRRHPTASVNCSLRLHLARHTLPAGATWSTSLPETTYSSVALPRSLDPFAALLPRHTERRRDTPGHASIWRSRYAEPHEMDSCNGLVTQPAIHAFRSRVAVDQDAATGEGATPVCWLWYTA
ncbi:hypothetical protein SPRG_19485 [Saprolegnia parasitica CBS 223.65]|uniref:Uncharacterized protein n=1 Tax=Saprolegnia parasitica (strain CBS 223.65) TaxID=695850 RepID=A0A067CNU1_SAPPC|nr:hypothetical protein SPRG_19485 [Saprolegnia parasitica CBS 223.65]KDO32163.1 hypothetical protein SPRG_19485 [Saprolegnia parasitica CBS 223.65]|eukprot:XP_012197410.1 hypothetical protein SPRG_19485 [Saprolegnia parasitica CBS 223.65]